MFCCATTGTRSEGGWIVAAVVGWRMVIAGQRKAWVGGASRLAWSFLPAENPLAAKAYCCAIVGLVPGLGLLAGALAVWLGVWGWRVGRTLPRRAGVVHAKVSCFLGGCEFVTHLLALLCFTVGAYQRSAQ